MDKMKLIEAPKEINVIASFSNKNTDLIGTLDDGTIIFFIFDVAFSQNHIFDIKNQHLDGYYNKLLKYFKMSNGQYSQLNKIVSN